MSHEARLQRLGLYHLKDNPQELERVQAEYRAADKAWVAMLDALEASGTARNEAVKAMPPRPVLKDFVPPQP